MAKDDKKDAKEKVELTPEEAAAKSKKKKLIIIIAAGVLLAAGGGGGAFFMLAGGDKKPDASAEVKADDAHGEKKDDAHAEKKDDGHGEKKADAHAEKKDDGHGEKKDDAHAEKKDDGHGEKKADAHGEAKDAPKKDDKTAALKDIGDFGCTLPFAPPFNVNLRNALGSHYMRLELAVEYPCSDDEAKAELERRMPQLRDTVISVASNKSREFLLGPDGMDQLRRDIVNRVNHFMTRKIKAVYITDILIE